VDTSNIEQGQLPGRLGHRNRSASLVANTSSSQVPVLEMPSPAHLLGPIVTINAPVIKRISGKAKESQTITDFISQIEKHARYEYAQDIDAQVTSRLSIFRTNLKGEARTYYGMLDN
jgi:hypothetical protein